MKAHAHTPSIALINSIANLGGQVGPMLAGMLERSTGSFTPGLLLSAALLLASGLLAMALGDRSGRHAAP